MLPNPCASPELTKGLVMQGIVSGFLIEALNVADVLGGVTLAGKAEDRAGG